MNDGMEEAQRLTQVRVGGIDRLLSFLLGLFLPFLSYVSPCARFSFCFCSISYLSYISAGMKGSGGELRHLAGSPGGEGGFWVLSYSNQSAYSMNKHQQQHTRSRNTVAAKGNICPYWHGATQIPP